MHDIRCLTMALLAASACSHNAHHGKPEPVVQYECTAAREFITTVNYLNEETKAKPATAMAAARDMAMQVAKGCKNAARRFALVRDMLLDAKFAADIANKTALSFAQSEDPRSDAFLAIFRAAYEDAGLDLTNQDALRLALRLSLDFKGDETIVGPEFAALTSYCVRTDELNLPRKFCADLAEKLLTSAESHRLAFAQTFADLVEFMRDASDGPKLTTRDAVNLARDLIAVSPYAAENFKRSFLYFNKQKSLVGNRHQQVKLAQQIALLSKSQGPLTSAN